MKNIIKLITIIWVIVSLSFGVKAIEKKTYIVGVETYVKYPLHSPYNDEFVGKYRIILDKFAAENGYEFTYVPYKYKELYNQFYSSKVDLKFPDNPIWRAHEKAKYNVIYSDYIYNYIDAIFVKQSNLGRPIKSYKRMGIIENAIVWTLNKKAKKNKIKLIKATSCAELLALLMNSHIDSMLCNYDVMQYLLKDSLAEKEVTFDPNLPFIDDYYYMSTINYPKIIQKFNNWLSENRAYIKQVMHDEYPLSLK